MVTQSTTKKINPKDLLGIQKVPFSVLSAPVMGELGLAMFEGARKYGRHNYRIAGVRASIYYDACLRHLMAWWEGEDIDADSKMCHVVKAMACLMILRDGMLIGNWKDDRPPKSKGVWVNELNSKTKDIIKIYPKLIEPYTELNIKEGFK